mmetsp:Transcript_14194/g.23621  ORF Transcript_14194/g.23621 Transcript_14194/m.23621 type:complete len:204 (+) Transcript_14194:512-1123(+)
MFCTHKQGFRHDRGLASDPRVATGASRVCSLSTAVLVAHRTHFHHGVGNINNFLRFKVTQKVLDHIGARTNGNGLKLQIHRFRRLAQARGPATRPIALRGAHLVHLSDVGSGPHEHRRRGARSLRPKVVAPLHAVVVGFILGHELLLFGFVVQHVLRGGVLGVPNHIQHLVLAHGETCVLYAPVLVGEIEHMTLISVNCVLFT